MNKKYREKIEGCKKVIQDIRGFKRHDVPFMESAIAIDSLTIYGNGEQDGVPSSTSPVDVQAIGDRVTNLFDISKPYKIVNSSYVASATYGSRSGDIFTVQYGGYGTGIFVYIKDDYLSLDAGWYTLAADVYLPSMTSLTTKTVNFALISPAGIDPSGTNVTANKGVSVDYDEWKHVSVNLYLPESRNTYLLRIQPSGNKGAYSNMNFQFKNVQLEKGRNKTTGYNDFGKFQIPIRMTSQNLFDIDPFVDDSASLTYTNNGVLAKAYPITYNLAGSNALKSFVKLLKPNVTYTLYRKCTGWRNGTADGVISLLNVSGSTIFTTPRNTTRGVATFTFTQEQLDSINKMYIYGNTTTGVTFTELALYEGSYSLSSLPEYTPCVNKIVPIYLDEPLVKIGTCCDKLDVRNKILHKECCGINLPTSGWEAYDDTQTDVKGYYCPTPDGMFNGDNEILCSHFPPNRDVAPAGSLSINYEGICILPYDFIKVAVSRDVGPHRQDFIDWVAKNNVMIYGKLTHPVDIPLEIDNIKSLIPYADKDYEFTIDTKYEPDIEIVYRSNYPEGGI